MEPAFPDLVRPRDRDELEAQLHGGFSSQLDEIPLNEIRPAASMVAYRTHCTTWTPSTSKAHSLGLLEGEEIHLILNREGGTCSSSLPQKTGRTLD